MGYDADRAEAGYWFDPTESESEIEAYEREEILERSRLALENCIHDFCMCGTVNPDGDVIGWDD